MCKNCGSCSREHPRSIDDAVDTTEASIASKISGS